MEDGGQEAQLDTRNQQQRKPTEVSTDEIPVKIHKISSLPLISKWFKNTVDRAAVKNSAGNQTKHQVINQTKDMWSCMKYCLIGAIVSAETGNADSSV